MSDPDGGGWTVPPPVRNRLGVRSATVFPDVLNGYKGIKARMTSTGDRKDETALGIDISKAHLDAHRLADGHAAQFDNDPAASGR